MVCIAITAVLTLEVEEVLVVLAAGEVAETRRSESLTSLIDGQFVAGLDERR